MLEQQNWLSNSEYIAKAMLDQSGCQLDTKRTNLFEQYRKMALGNIAPDIALTDGKKLSKLNVGYKLVVFGASWCPNCQRDYPSLVGLYKQLKEKNEVEFVYVSLDNDTKAFQEFYKEAPFITYCDTKSWESQPVKDYYVFATPTYFLLDNNLKIVAKPKNPEEVKIFF
jgi:thiol-disulfide isomerase/thioredoxin